MFDTRQADENGYVETDPTGRYGRFDEVLGKGAMKTVYKGFDEVNGLEVAWNQAKLSDVLRSPDALQRMYSEVHLLGTLHHESIIRFHASWINVGHRTFNFITELFTSGTLRGYRQKYRRVDIRAVKSWARQILNGLVYLHSHEPPVIHRDLKCDNIFVNGHLGQVKIGDLGLATVLRDSQIAHSVIGTPEFMAPELYEEEYNELVDVYSFGMCVLEMLTSDYPYSECTNPAQIYKKVTMGKLPDAFYRLSDPEARRFIGRCLVAASKRPSAHELLLDQFLVSNDRLQSPIPNSKSAMLKPNDSDFETSRNLSDMTITGKMNHEDDTIFLKVLITDKDEHMRNVYFPFDVVSDTPIDVASEMVRELEIADREPSEIAEMIEHEISILVPDWKERGLPVQKQEHEVYSYTDDEPFSPTSSLVSEFGLGSPRGVYCGGDLYSDDDDKSSIHSGKYSSISYHANEDHTDQKLHQPQPTTADPQKLTRFGSEERTETDSLLTAKFQKRCILVPPDTSKASTSHGGKRRDGGRRMMRNQSMVDMRSQLLRRTLQEDINKRIFKTVGAVENIGFQNPCDDRGSRKGSFPRVDRRKSGHTWGLGWFF